MVKYNDTDIASAGKNIFVYVYKSKENSLDKAKKANIKLNDDYETNVCDFKKLKNNSKFWDSYATTYVGTFGCKHSIF